MIVHSTQLRSSHGVLASRINAFIEFLGNNETHDNSDHVRLLKRIFELGNELPTSPDQHIAHTNTAGETLFVTKG